MNSYLHQSFADLSVCQSLLPCRYYVEFSKPDKLRPIPEGTVKVFFDITVDGDKDEYDVEFNFENESLKHRMDSTMREDMFQVSAPIRIFFYLLTVCYITI